jgi:hypothetical protein
MGRWWGRGRSPQPGLKAVSLQAAPDPGWRGLAPIAPTLGPPAATVPLHEFTSSLTTSINPGLVEPPAPVSTGQGGQLAVLRMISEPVQVNSPAQPVLASAPRARRWSPRLPLQLTPVDSTPPPIRQLQAWSSPIEDINEQGSGADGLTHPLVESGDPQEHRSVPVTTAIPEEPAVAAASRELNAAQEPTDVSSHTSSPSATPVVSAMTAASQSAPGAAPMPTVARLPETNHHSAIEQPTPRPTIGDVQPLTPPRPPVSVPVQRVADSDENAHTHEVVAEQNTAPAMPEPTPFPHTAPDRPDMTPEPTPSARSIPAEPTPSESFAAEHPQNGPALPMRIVTPLAPLQRAMEADLPSVPTMRPATSNPVARPSLPAQSTPSDTASPTPPSPSPVTTDGIEAGETSDGPTAIAAGSALPDVDLRAAEIVQPSVCNHDPDPVVQRHVDTTPAASPRAAHVDLPAAAIVSTTVATPTASATELTMPAAVAAPRPIPSEPVQRIIAEQVPPQETRAIPAPSTALADSVGVETTAPRLAVQQAVQRSPSQAAHAESSGATFAPPAGPRSAPVIKSVPQQPSSLPVVQPIRADVHSESPSVATASIAVQSSSDIVPPSGRLVLLPPVRRSTDDLEPGPPHLSSESVIADSARPMSLQRMFEHTAQSAEPNPEAAHTNTSDYQQAPQTITFDSPVLQREAEPAAAPPQDVGAAPAASTGPAQGAGAAGGAALPTNVDELVNRIYDPLAARLRAELWMDRERAGALMNLHR